MAQPNYPRDNWIETTPDKLARRLKVQQWRPEIEELIAPAKIQDGQRVLDFGCGSGEVTVKLALQVGPRGSVVGADISMQLLNEAKKLYDASPCPERLAFVEIQDVEAPNDRLPFEDSSFDRVICKNVLEYVTDLQATLGELRRVLRTDGLVLVVDSDWGFVIVSPWTCEETSAFFSAAACAFRDQYIGRRIRQALSDAGFRDISVEIQPNADYEGRLLTVLENMQGYIEDGWAMGFNEEPKLHTNEAMQLMNKAYRACETDNWMCVLPQFIVTGKK